MDTIKIPILSDAEPPIMEEPQNPGPSVEPASIKIALEVFCCPCPKEESKSCDGECKKCTCKDCDGNDCCVPCVRKADTDKDDCCQRWFPFFSKVSN